nr:MAG TPA: hypothetical protein [Caudoviricetes sp.]
MCFALAEVVVVTVQIQLYTTTSTGLEAVGVVVTLKPSELVLQNKHNTKQSLELEVLVQQRMLLAAKAGLHR